MKGCVFEGCERLLNMNHILIIKQKNNNVNKILKKNFKKSRQRGALPKIKKA